MKKFMDDNFMLNNETAAKLFNDYAKDMPIFDYHCHLSPQMMYEDKPFENITQIFLGGDHYKWRYMRSNGIDESYITGDKSDYDKFKAFCGCLQYAIGNPLYHWTHLELKRYFNVDEVVTAAYGQFLPSKLLDSMDFTDYNKALGNVCGMNIKNYDELITAVNERIDYFHNAGCRISDHALDGVPFNRDYSADDVFVKKMNGENLSADEINAFKCETLIRLAKKYSELDWAMQLHIGALRNNNSAMFKKLGADVGFDSIADYEIAADLSALLDAMECNDGLPKTILYTLNPKDNYVLATMLGNFQSAETAGKMQFGSAWWFNDQRDGMVEQMKALANLGALNKFVGMLTDSRSFLSYTRHEYFRRILCNMLGEWVENGEFPDDFDTLGKIVEDICFNNAKRYFNVEM